MDAKHTPTLASYLRDSVKVAFKPESDHADRVYEAALALEQHAQLVAALSALVGVCYETDMEGSESLAIARALLEKVRLSQQVQA